jgi:hypothetical protein
MRTNCLTRDLPRRSLCGGFVVLALALASCSALSTSSAPTSSGATGFALKADSAAAAQAPSVISSPAQVASANPPQPCELLSSPDRSSLGVSSVGAPSSVGRSHACDWEVPDEFGITVTIENQASSSSRATTSDGRSFSLGGHQARQISDRQSAGVCAIVLSGAKTDFAVHIDVNNANFHDSSVACQRATRVAKLIEPKLP